jgi:hypothetical protein
VSPNERVVTGSLVTSSVVEISQSEFSWGPDGGSIIVSDSRRIRGELEVENLGNEMLVGGGSIIWYVICIAYVSSVGMRTGKKNRGNRWTE